MVHRIYPVEEEENKSPLPEKSSRRRVSVKSEDTDGGFGFVSKRPRIHFPHQEGDGEYNPLAEPSPLGLKLKKSPSLLDLIQMRLSQQDKTPCSLAKTLATKEKTTATATATATAAALDKLKASNFPASLLKIGSWEYKSRYEGDLVAKCYFAKHKLVWEVLDGGLKNKIEIQWSDIVAIKPTYPQPQDGQPETLDVVVGRQPLFFREINPQPRKHTLWQATTDFTSGQATIHRQHFLQFPPGSMQKHFEKLMQCDPRLRFLSQQPEIVLESPYFLSSNVLESPMVSMFGDSNDCDHRFPSKANGRFGFSGFTDTTASVSGLSSSDIDNQDLLDSSTMEKPQGHNHSRSENFSIEDVSSKVNATCGLVLLNQIKLPGVHPSMSVGDLISTIGDCISEQMKSDNPNLAINESQKMNILEEISQYLLNDSQPIAVSDENEESIMSRVNSLCCLLQKESDLPVLNVGRSHNHTAETSYASAIEGTTSMSRKDSFGEFLLNLPRIASLPQFLNSVPEDQYSETLKGKEC